MDVLSIIFMHDCDPPYGALTQAQQENGWSQLAKNLALGAKSVVGSLDSNNEIVAEVIREANDQIEDLAADPQTARDADLFGLIKRALADVEKADFLDALTALVAFKSTVGRASADNKLQRRTAFALEHFIEVTRRSCQAGDSS